MTTATLPPQVDSTSQILLGRTRKAMPANQTRRGGRGLPSLPPSRPPLHTADAAVPAPDSAEPLRKAAFWLCLVVVLTAAYSYMTAVPI